MNQKSSKDYWGADSPSTSSGRFSENTVNHGLKRVIPDDIEMTLMKIRRLSMKLMSKTERMRYSERKLCRSNVFKFLGSHLSHTSEKVRYLTLEVLCYTVPRLGEKTNKLLKPIMPKVIQCLQGNEEKDIKLKALHFLRAYFRHTRNLSGFIEDFVHFGLGNADPEVRISCFYGFNIIFDQDIGNNLFSPLVVAIANHLGNDNPHKINRAAYTALKFIHSTIGDERFFDLMSTVNPGSLNAYKDFFTFEASDPFLSIRDNDCSTLISAYQLKRKNLNLNKNFGILECNLLDNIGKTRNCERAKFVAIFADALKKPMWTDADLESHIQDLLKLTISFICDSNRLIQMSGLDILKETINVMGFILSPHIRCIVQILLETVTSSNIKIKSNAERVLHKLMRNTHPMTVIWELLDSSTPSQKEAVLILVKKKIKCFLYHELDMLALCNHLGQSLEHKNPNIAKYSRDCISLLLDVMGDCPSYDNRSQAVQFLLKNYKLSRDTLKYIGILGHGEDDYLESFESYSGDETVELELENALLEYSEATSGTEDIISETASVRTRCFDDAFNTNITSASSRKQRKGFVTPDISENSNHKLTEKSRQDFLSKLEIRKLPLADNSATKKAVHNQNKASFFPGNSVNVHENHSHNMKTEQKYFTCFCLKHLQNVEATNDNFQDTKAGGEAEMYLRKNSTNLQKEELCKDPGAFVTDSYEKDGIQVDVMNKDIFNFNIMQIENHQDTDDIEEVNNSSSQGCKTPGTSTPICPPNLNSAQTESPEIVEDIQDFEESDTLSNVFPVASISNITPLDAGRNKHTGFSSKDDSTENYEYVSHTDSPNFFKVKLNNKEESETEYYENKIVQSKESNIVSNVELLKDGNDGCCIQEAVQVLNEVKRKHKSIDLENRQDSNVSDNNKQEGPKTIVKSLSLSPSFEENETPFLPKTRQLPRTPVEKNKDYSSEIIPKIVKNRKRYSVTNKKKKAEEKTRKHADGDFENTSMKCDKPVMKSAASSLPLTGRDATARQSCAVSKHNSSSNWGGCQWRRDLDYAAKGKTCGWADNFENLVRSIQPLPSQDIAENEMKKVIEDLYGNSWMAKEEAMLKVIRLAKHHPELVYDNTSKIALALINEIKNIRQSVAGKAILTTGHLYEIMGKYFENKLRIVVAALLAKSGNRTLAAYYRLVVKCLVKIINSTTPQKAAIAFIQESSRQANKSARETAAQFLSILTKSLGPENSMANPLSSQMMKCAAMFVLDSSALTRYCGKRMFEIFMKHPDFEKLKDHHLDANTVQSLNKTLEQIKTKGIKQEILPINIIE